MNKTVDAVDIIVTYLDTNCSVRELGKIFGLSKTAIHRKLKRCKYVLPEYVKLVENKAKENKYSGQLRGGETTKHKWHNKAPKIEREADNGREEINR